MKQTLKNFINNLYTNYIEHIKLDSVLHAYISTILYILCFNISNNLLLSCCITLFIGIVVKELLIDSYIRDGKFDINDVKSNLIGVIIGILLCL